jgi:copper resistance protein C
MRLLFPIIFCVVLLTLSPGHAYAHASLYRAVPSDGQVVTPAPTSIKLVFDEPLEASFSLVHVVDQSGRQVDNGKSEVRNDDPKTVEVGLFPLLPGTYKVIWKIVARDGHKTSGSYSFTVK